MFKKVKLPSYSPHTSHHNWLHGFCTSNKHQRCFTIHCNNCNKYFHNSWEEHDIIPRYKEKDSEFILLHNPKRKLQLSCGNCNFNSYVLWRRMESIKGTPQYEAYRKKQLNEYNRIKQYKRHNALYNCVCGAKICKHCGTSHKH